MSDFLLAVNNLWVSHDLVSLRITSLRFKLPSLTSVGEIKVSGRNFSLNEGYMNVAFGNLQISES